VLLSAVDLQRIHKSTNHLENKGFFRATVSGDTVVKKKKGSAIYTVAAGNQYTINKMQFRPIPALWQWQLLKRQKERF
jgi:outer membrane protein assembly factor BamA